MIQNKTILVTGGAGFIGSHLVEALTGENDVRILDDLSAGKSARIPEEVEFVQGDICDEQVLERAMDDVDIVFHEAANVSVERSVEEPIRSHEVNVDATLALLEQARTEEARVVIASSAAVYGDPDVIPISESDQKDPTSPYGLEKLSIDRYARLYHDLYDVETVTLRYFNVYGPRQSGAYSGVIDIFLEQALNGDPLTIEGDGEQTRDFVHVDDVVRANLLAAVTDHTGIAYNIGTGSSVSIRQLAKTIRSLTETAPDIVHTSPRPADIDRSEADISRAREQLGYEPTVRLEDGLRSLVEARARKQSGRSES